jgi:hypothetical protein
VRDRRDLIPRTTLEADNERAMRPWPRYVTARVAADYCDASPWTIRRHLQPCGRRGRIYIYSLEEVERWMRGQPLANAT